MSLQDPFSTIRVSAASSDPDSIRKKFACTWQGCAKSFSRSEHLHRHALNHREGDNTCPRCAAHFRRRDLLDRHMTRHKEKDDEAGGEGLGHLATRKRLWRDRDGKIINGRRPYRHIGGKRQRLPSQKESEQTSHTIENDFSNIPTTVPSFSQTLMPSAELGCVELSGGNTSLLNTWEADLGSGQNLWQHDSFDFLNNADWDGNQQLQTHVLSSCDLPYDDIFKLDPAMSFNAPFTTSSYYGWLFPDGGSNTISSTTLSTPSWPTDMLLGGSSSMIVDNTEYCSSPTTEPYRGPHPADTSPDVKRDNHNSSNFDFKCHNHDKVFNEGTMNPHHQRSKCFSTPLNEVAHGLDSHSSRLQNNAQGVMKSTEYTASASGVSDQSDPNSSNAFTSPSTMGSLSCHDSSSPVKSSTSQISNPSDQEPIRNTHPLPDTYTDALLSDLPIISSAARDGIMLEISQYHRSKSDGSEISSSDALLSLSALQRYSDLFFTRFNSSYPLVHQATFDSDNVHSFLLMSILLLGASYSDKEAHLLAIGLHDIMRPLIHSSKEFGTRPKLWMLQTILLVECFGKSRAGQKQHDMSHLYHGLLINLIRRSDCQSAHVPLYSAQSHDLEEHWRLSVEAEQKRRLAMLCFMWDTQHAVLFSQSLCMNASELKLTLPWDNAMWSASSALEWLQLSQSTPPPPQYLEVLKMYTNPSKSSHPPCINALSRVLVFHGLMSISWDLNRRDQTSLSLSITSSNIPWQTRMAICYEKWKSDFEAYTSSVLKSLSSDPKHRDAFQRFVVAHMAVYHTAQLILNVDIIDLQIHAGARHIIGRPVTEADRARTKNRIKTWSGEGKIGGIATWHAACLLRDGIRKPENWKVDEMFHYPWCLFLATLTCWTFHNAVAQGSPSTFLKADIMVTDTVTAQPELTNSSTAIEEEPSISKESYDADSDWDSRMEMKALISSLTKLDPTEPLFARDVSTICRRCKTQGLLRCIVRQLHTIRWAVVREGMIVLRRLIYGSPFYCCS